MQTKQEKRQNVGHKNKKKEKRGATLATQISRARTTKKHRSKKNIKTNKT